MTTGLAELTPVWLTTFLAVARHRNFTRAAEELLITQPAVSRQMRGLQEAVGVPLIEQLGKSLALTDAGRAFLHEAERVRGGIARAAEVVAALRQGDRGSLRLGASTTPGLYLLPRVVATFIGRRPGIDLTYKVDDTLGIEEALLRNELDVGFVGGRLASGDLATEPLVNDRLAIYAARSHPLAHRRRVEPARLADETFVLRERGSATRRLFDEWLAANRIEVRAQIEVPSPEDAKALVAAGLGLAVSSRFGLADDRRLKALDVRGFSIERPILIARHKDKRLSPLQHELVAAVQRAVGRRS